MATVLGEWPKCKICGSTELLTPKAVQEVIRLGRPVVPGFLAQQVHTTPIEVVQKAEAAVGIKKTALQEVVWFDVCAGCGMLRAVRAELVEIPINVRYGHQAG